MASRIHRIYGQNLHLGRFQSLGIQNLNGLNMPVKYYSTPASEPNKKSLITTQIEKAKEMVKFYFNGSKLFLEESKQAKLLEMNSKNGSISLSRPEFLLVHRNKQDWSVMLPFMLIVLVVPESIPFLLMRGFNIAPSTCISPAQRVIKARLSIAPKIVDGDAENLNKLDRASLVHLSTYYGLSKWRPTFTLVKNLKRYAEYLEKDTQYLRNDASILNMLSEEELREALEQRGIEMDGLSTLLTGPKMALASAEATVGTERSPVNDQ